VLVRLTRMRQVDLDLFDFDYDLTWMGFFLAPDGRVLGRYGGRDPESPDSRVSLAGLRHAMHRALARHRAGQPADSPVRNGRSRTVEDFSAASRLSRTACVHCHQVYDLRRESLEAAGKWRLDEVWVYPMPENVGMTLAVDDGDRLARVKAGSAADKAGLRQGDRLLSVNGHPVASFADVQYALHRAPARGKLGVTWARGTTALKGQLVLPEGWRRTDVSWRWSLRGLNPSPWVGGDDLTVAEKKALGLAPTRLAFRQSGFVSEPARQAGIRPGDVVVGIDGKPLHLTARQFAAHVRLAYKVGDRVTYNLLRDGKPLDATLTLRRR
jgi:hypothetical protein